MTKITGQRVEIIVEDGLTGSFRVIPLVCECSGAYYYDDKEDGVCNKCGRIY